MLPTGKPEMRKYLGPPCKVQTARAREVAKTEVSNRWSFEKEYASWPACMKSWTMHMMAKG
jgi:hypothetical protein